MRNYIPTTKANGLNELLQLIARTNLTKNPAKFFIKGEEAVERTKIVENLQERSDLVLIYDLKKREISTIDNHTARVLLKEGFELITWNYEAIWRPLERSKSSPNTKKLLEIKSRRLLNLEEKDGVVYSGDEKTTKILQNDYGFRDLEN